MSVTLGRAGRVAGGLRGLLPLQSGCLVMKDMALEVTLDQAHERNQTWCSSARENCRFQVLWLGHVLCIGVTSKRAVWLPSPSDTTVKTSVIAALDIRSL